MDEKVSVTQDQIREVLREWRLAPDLLTQEEIDKIPWEVHDANNAKWMFERLKEIAK